MDPVNIFDSAFVGPILLWILTAAALALFIIRIRRLVALLRGQQPPDQHGPVCPTIRRFLRLVLLHPWVFKPDGRPGVLAFTLLVLVVPYVLLLVWSLLRGLLPCLAVPYPFEIKPVVCALEALSLLILAAITVAGLRRIFFAPPHLRPKIDQITFIVSLCLKMLALSTLLTSTFYIVANGNAYTRWAPFGTAMSYFVLPRISLMDLRTAQTFLALSWWLNILAALTLLAYLPCSRHLHFPGSPFVATKEKPKPNYG